MYKIKVVFRSNVIGVYTEHIETATNLSQMRFKRYRLLEQWMAILCPHIDASNLKSQHLKVAQGPYELMDEEFKLYITVINSHLELINSYSKGQIESGKEQHRQFDVTIEEIN
jgi:hypothetical protein